jgi:hypothetical protein
MDRKEQRTASITFAIGGVFPMKNRDRLCSGGSFVVIESSVLRMNPDSYWDAKKPAHRKSAKRW